jgi:hypothetical protein
MKNYILGFDVHKKYTQATVMNSVRRYFAIGGVQLPEG